MIRYRPFELHCHTRHSDGQFTVKGLMESAADYGYEGIALTDHNTTSALLEVTPALERQTCAVIPGIEWTTFYGHLLVLGCHRFVDWRFVEPDTIDQALAEIKEAGGATGIAHPWEIGAPLMCGCKWEFHVTRWDLVDYIELWSNDNPHSHSKNALALPWYDALLNQGYHLAVSAGRDWHGPDQPGKVPLLTATYLGIEGSITVESALDSIRAGRTYVSMGPTIAVSLQQNSQKLGLGETAMPGSAVISVSVGETQRRDIWGRHRIHVEQIRLVCNGQVLDERPYQGDAEIFSSIVTQGWLRVELWGSYAEVQSGLLGLTSPIYVEESR